VKRILLVEDNADLAFGLRNNLEIDGYAVEVAEEGKKALRMMESNGADLVILDLMLPELDGFRVLRALRERGHEVPVLVLTARGEESDKVRALKLGADDYVLKPFGLLELLARVEALLRRVPGSHSRSPAPLRLGAVVIEPDRRRVSRDGVEIDLAPKELDLLLALLRHRGNVVPRLQLMREVWGYDDSVSSRTIDTHIAELRRKLEDDASKPRHLITVRKIGYRVDE
jgi:two-component system, OmpR family, alkaline phosphatase synthesis response regulator PhoP